MKTNKQTSYKVGDTVKLISKFPKAGWVDSMKPYLGNVVKITKIVNSQFWFDGSEPWSFIIDNIESKVQKVVNYEKVRVEEVLNDLLKANNTATTLEVKTELRKRYPKTNWTQSVVSDTMNELYLEGKYTFKDNGTYRIYSSAIKTTKTNNMKNKTTSTTPTVTGKKQRISRTKAINLLSNTNGRFFGVTFTKKDGTVRKMKCKVENEVKPTPLGYLTVVDVKEATHKSLNLQTLSEIRMNKNVYLVG